MHGGQRRIFFWLNLTPLLRRLLRSTRHAKKRHTVPRLTLELTPASPWNLIAKQGIRLCSTFLVLSRCDFWQSKSQQAAFQRDCDFLHLHLAVLRGAQGGTSSRCDRAGCSHGRCLFVRSGDDRHPQPDNSQQAQPRFLRLRLGCRERSGCRKRRHSINRTSLRRCRSPLRSLLAASRRVKTRLRRRRCQASPIPRADTRFLLMASRPVCHPASVPPKRPSRRHRSDCQFPEIPFSPLA